MVGLPRTTSQLPPGLRGRNGEELGNFYRPDIWDPHLEADRLVGFCETFILLNAPQQLAQLDGELDAAAAALAPPNALRQAWPLIRLCLRPTRREAQRPHQLQPRLASPRPHQSELRSTSPTARKARHLPPSTPTLTPTLAVLPQHAASANLAAINSKTFGAASDAVAEMAQPPSGKPVEDDDDYE
jgi:hypothetical protein